MLKVLSLWLGVYALSACSTLPRAEAAPFQVLRDMPYVAAGDSRQVADIYLPSGSGPRAAVMVIHGGSWTRGERADMEKYALRLAHKGYVVMNLTYRFAPEHRFPAQAHDVAAAHRWLRSHAEEWQLDPQRIAALGYSAGAHLALMHALEPGEGQPRLAAVVAGAGPTDMSVYYDSPYLINLIGGSGHDYPERYAQASPLQHVSADDPPVLLYHGTWDRLVEFEQSQKLEQALAAAGVEHELVSMRFKGHITGFLFDGAAYSAIEEFLAKHLGDPNGSA